MALRSPGFAVVPRCSMAACVLERTVFSLLFLTLLFFQDRKGMWVGEVDGNTSDE